MADQIFVFPTSFAQQRLWFINRLVPGHPAYNVHVTVPLGTLLNPDIFRGSVNEIVCRHESLRTTFDVRDGLPVQIVHPYEELPIPVIALESQTESQQDEELLRLANAEAQRPFDLRVGPLIRTTLLKRKTGHYVLLLTMHHIISDGWSLGVFFNELTLLYEAFAQARSSPLDELPIQYADFAVWQHEWLQGEVLDQQLSYWKEQLNDLSTLQLPTDHRRPPAATFTGAAHTFDLPARLTTQLKALSRSQDATLFILLFTAFKILLHRYTGQEDIVVGTPIANRNVAEVEKLIGFFVNTLVVRTDLSGDPTFAEALARVREVALAAYSHQDLPFEMLVEALRPNRDLSRNPLFQVVFQLHNTPALDGLGMGSDDGSAPPFELQRGTANFDLTFDLWETGGGLGGRLNYATDLFDAATIVRLAGNYRVLLEAIVADPHRRISSLSILEEQEQQRLLSGWNETATAYPRDTCIHELFEQWANRTPDAVALVFGGQNITYGELNRRANRIALLLQTAGVGHESLVGLCVERSVEMVVGMLGILKAGGAYVALDSSLPAKRLGLTIEDAGIRVVLSQDKLAKLLLNLAAAVICLDGEACDDGSADENFSGPATAGSLAYVCYTSGSSGTPKGVMVVHRSVVRLVRENNYATLKSAEIFLQFSPLSFDASTFEIWGSLLNGARLVIHPPGAASLEELGRTIAGNSVTTLWLTAGLFNQMVDHQPGSLRGVSRLLSGGDVLSAAHVKKALLVPGQREIINGYGPTEGTTFTCCGRYVDGNDIGETVPIGRPVGNTRVYVLDRNLNPVPVGVPGELYIGGDGLARGYLSQPALTSEKFVPDLFSPIPGQRLYRTGDTVRYLVDGRIEFIGRLDRQAKLRGFRVEPAEVEALLLRCPGILSAHVMLVGSGDDKRLAAYFVPDAAGTPSIAELRSFLEEQLPAYMVPAHYQPLDEIPLTHNGKVDEARLPSCERMSPIAAGEKQFTAPSGELEEVLAGIWCQVLKLERIDVHDNFFSDLSGHSLLATQVVSRVRESFGLELPLRSFFESPTIARLAAVIEETLIAEIDLMSDEQATELLSGPQSEFLENAHVD